MKKKTKLIAVLLCLVLFASMAMGSGSSDSAGTKDVSTASDETKENATDDDKEVATSTDTTIEEAVIVDQDGIVITALEYTTDSIWGEGIKLLVENNSEKNVTVSCKSLIVNDYMISDLFVSSVAAGKKANETMYLSSAALKAAGIDSVGQIEIYFRVYDSDSYDDIFSTEVVTIQTSEFANMDTTPDDAGIELYNEGGVRIVGKTVDENSFWGSAILLYIENTSGINVGIRCEDMSINGFMMTPIFSCDIYDGKKAIDEITILSSDLETNGIESIDEVELKFHIYNVDTYGTIADTEAITFSAQ